ncbi:MAG: LysR family transcriptional regulator [Clostridium sp.]|nr:LysR family transcriptional regulator [Clostridium sp.]
MTILQLKYVIAIDEERSMRKAADRLYVSQPGLSSAVKDLEKELGFAIFERVHSGVVTTAAGASFIGYARGAVEQFEKVEEKFLNSRSERATFSVSLQHYAVAVDAFIDTVKAFDPEEYQFYIRETQTSQVIEDVKTMKSEVGLIAFSDFNKRIFKKEFSDASLKFHEIFKRDTYAYLARCHPLADRKEVSLEELQDYPCIIFTQGDNTSFYYREEALATYDYRKIIHVNERATSVEMINGLNAYAVGAGMLGISASASGIHSVKLKEEEPLTFGYITRKSGELSDMAKYFISRLENYKDFQV